MLSQGIQQVPCHPESPSNHAPNTTFELLTHRKGAKEIQIGAEKGKRKNPPDRSGGFLIELNESGLDAFEDHGDALTTTDTHGDEAVLAADTVHFVDRLGGDKGTGTANRVAEGDSTAIRVGLGRIQAE